MDIYARVTFHIRPDEISGGVNGMTFWKLIDSAQGHIIGIKYSYGAQAWQVYSDTGGLVSLPFAPVDADFSMTLNAIVQTDGTVQVTVYHSGWGLVGQFNTPVPVNYDTFRVGAMDNSSNEVVDHYIHGVKLGITSGGSEIFNMDTQPFDSSVGGTFSWPQTGLLLVQNSGSTDAYLSKQIQTVVIPTSGPLIDPGDASIIFTNTDWAMSNQPSWQIDNWGLDKLVVSLRGSRRTRDAFLATLTPWMPFPGDPNMFLMDITQEQHGTTNFPQVNLVFTGKRGGILPQDREQQGEAVQQISCRSIFDPAHTLGLWFISPTSSKTVFSRAPIDLSTVNPLQPAQIDLMWLTETDVIIWAGVWEAYQALITTRVEACFVQRAVSTGSSDTLVPGQYYRASRTLQTLLFPILA